MGKSDWRMGFRHAFAGLHHVLSSQRNMRIHLAVMVVVIGVGLALGLSRWEWALLALTIGLVLAAEAFNTALEVGIDLASPEYHPLARRAKDASAGAVLLAALTAVAVGLLLLGPHLWRLLR